ncbi:MAG TPA: hypothetical protein PKA33_03490 [Amaricoccus sp.]|uniref:hypothetical protein n=1 Tax=Amaricoccus sp. TaxID=1872485 RepID=UPI002BAA36C6|nr:hypothetical protein [Amaricoccus sp.]HMQ92244.1 hypothetical protein [Amaricoccus sp.]HMR51649.1 hypothetical protein [Amaricoccus sp.]HMT98415.1 hypothetical protein [Amaricoccus sp.]
MVDRHSALAVDAEATDAVGRTRADHRTRATIVFERLGEQLVGAGRRAESLILQITHALF